VWKGEYEKRGKEGGECERGQRGEEGVGRECWREERGGV
jgi:hypothetical protein